MSKIYETENYNKFKGKITSHFDNNNNYVSLFINT